MKNRKVEVMDSRWLKILWVLIISAAGLTLQAQPETRVKLKDSTQVNPARPLDTINYTLGIENLSDEDLKNLNINRVGDPNTTLIPGSFQSTPIAIPAKKTEGFEDQLITLDLKGLDPDGDILVFSIIQSPQNGTLSGLNSLSATTAAINYQPNPAFNGTDQFSFSVLDDDGNRDTSLFEITLQPVNDAPGFTAGSDVSILEDSGAQSLAWASGISAGPVDESAQGLVFNILSNNNADLFENQPQLASDGTLTFTAKADSSGVALLEIQLMDDGGTANGGVDVSTVETLTITIEAVNDAPGFTAGSDVSIPEDAGAQSLAWASGISAGPADELGQVLTFNILSNNNANLFENQPQLASDGTLTFTAKADSSGVALLEIQLMDDGGTANGGVDVSTVETLTITIEAVNDAPGFTAGSDVSILEDAGAQSLAWASGISAGPVNESAQGLVFNILSNNNADLFENQPQLASDGTLTFTAKADSSGVALLEIQLMDDGGTGNGGVDVSTVETLTITVEAVNDAPGFTKGIDISVETITDSLIFTNWATEISAGPANETSQVLTFILESVDNEALFEILPQLTPDGTLLFKANPDAVGTAMVTIKLMDDGGTANGGVDTSDPQSFMIELTPAGG